MKQRAMLEVDPDLLVRLKSIAQREGVFLYRLVDRVVKRGLHGEFTAKKGAAK